MYPRSWRSAVVLEWAERDYKDNGNPLHVWQAIDILTQGSDSGFPPWVTEYLRRASGVILFLDINDDCKLEYKLTKALGIGKRHYNQLDKIDFEISICDAVEMKLLDNVGVMQAINLVAKDIGHSMESVRAVYYKWRMIRLERENINAQIELEDQQIHKDIRNRMNNNMTLEKAIEIIAEELGRPKESVLATYSQYEARFLPNYSSQLAIERKIVDGEAAD